MHNHQGNNRGAFYQSTQNVHLQSTNMNHNNQQHYYGPPGISPRPMGSMINGVRLPVVTNPPPRIPVHIGTYNRQMGGQYGQFHQSYRPPPVPTSIPPFQNQARPPFHHPGSSDMNLYPQHGPRTQQHQSMYHNQGFHLQHPQSWPPPGPACPGPGVRPPHDFPLRPNQPLWPNEAQRFGGPVPSCDNAPRYISPLGPPLMIPDILKTNSLKRQTPSPHETECKSEGKPQSQPHRQSQPRSRHSPSPSRHRQCNTGHTRPTHKPSSSDHYTSPKSLGQSGFRSSNQKARRYLKADSDSQRKIPMRKPECKTSSVSGNTEESQTRKRKHEPDVYFDPVTNDMAVAENADSPEDKESESEPFWVRSSPANLYFKKDRESGNLLVTTKMVDLENKFDKEIVQRSARVRSLKPKYTAPELKPWANMHRHKHHHHHCTESLDISSSSSESEDDLDLDDLCLQENEAELLRKQEHPEKLHSNLWFNEAGKMNDGPLCRCSMRSRKTGIRHYIYPGEKGPDLCDEASNNSNKLTHYRIIIQPLINVITRNPSEIEHDGHIYMFEGFSLFTHSKFENIPPCHFIRFNVEYTISFVEEDLPENFSIRSLNLVGKYLMTEIMELVDLDWLLPRQEGQCPLFHVMPRFSRQLPENGKELLSIHEVIKYLLKNNKPLLELTEIGSLLQRKEREWQKYVNMIQGCIVTYPGMRPSSIRIDQLDRTQPSDDVITYPLIIHFGTKPLQLSYLQNKNYRQAWKEYTKLKHLIANKAKVSSGDKTKLLEKEKIINSIRLDSELRREVTTEISSEGFYRTGIKADICQFALMIPVLIEHIRFHDCLSVFERDYLHYKFKDRSLLHLALTHPSHRVHYGTNPDHVRNSISNVGLRYVDYGDRRVQTVNYRKKGVITLMHIMAKMGETEETRSRINHNERLEFLGDAVLEFMTSVHLYYMFPDLEEGGLATYRSALVKNRHLALLGKKLHIEDFLLYSHGPDICRESELRHAVANCFEALLAAVFLDSDSIESADEVFARVMFDDDVDLYRVWARLPLHPLQQEEPEGDRHWIERSPVLQNLTKFEERTGIEFDHVRLLARAFTMRSVGFSNLTKGNNQRMEFLGDTVLNLLCTDKLFKHFPKHHEGHLSLLRSSLVNSRTQATVYNELGLKDFVVHRHRDTSNMKQKERADVVESLLGALYVDKDLDHCKVFCNVVFLPRLQEFIMNQDWNDPKSKLQQCCLTLRDLGTGEPDIPIYKTISCVGPTNTRSYTVAVYFRGNRLGIGKDHSIQRAQMKAATQALEHNKDFFPQLGYQERLIEKKYHDKEEYKRLKLKKKRKMQKQSTDNSDNESSMRIAQSASKREAEKPQLTKRRTKRKKNAPETEQQGMEDDLKGTSNDKNETLTMEDDLPLVPQTLAHACQQVNIDSAVPSKKV